MKANESAPPEVAYGCDQQGLIWGYRFSPNAAPQTIDAAEAAAWLDTAEASDDFVWLHFAMAHGGSQAWLQRHVGTTSLFADAIGGPVASTRVEQEDDALVAVINDVHFDFAMDASAISSISLLIQRRLVVSARLKPLRSVDRLRALVRSGRTFRSSAELLAHFLWEQANVLVGILRRCTGRIDAIEDGLLTDRLSLSRNEIGDLRRMLVRLQRLLAPEPAALFRLLNRPPGWVKAADVQDLRQAAEEFATAVVDSGALIERAKLLQEELGARLDEHGNRTLRILTIVTVLALPINLTAGLFGMNVGGIPLAQSGHGFAIVVILLTLFTAVLAYAVFGRRQS